MESEVEGVVIVEGVKGGAVVEVTMVVPHKSASGIIIKHN